MDIQVEAYIHIYTGYGGKFLIDNGGQVAPVSLKDSVYSPSKATFYMQAFHCFIVGFIPVITAAAPPTTLKS